MDGREGIRRIVLADDHALLLAAFAHILKPVGEVVATARDGARLVELVKEHRPDLVIADLSMPVLSGVEAVRQIRALPSPPPVIVLTVHAEPGMLHAAFAAGAQGYVLKNSESSELLEAVAAVARGEHFVTPSIASTLHAEHVPLISERERQVLGRLAGGMSVKAIAMELEIAPRTVVFHKDRLRQRFGARSVPELIALALRGGHISSS
jgi:DNA-binding NarL/FixJ family response regulator